MVDVAVLSVVGSLEVSLPNTATLSAGAEGGKRDADICHHAAATAAPTAITAIAACARPTRQRLGWAAGRLTGIVCILSAASGTSDLLGSLIESKGGSLGSGRTTTALADWS